MSPHYRATAPDFQERYDVLLDIGRILTATLEPGELYRVIYEQVSRVLEATGFFISLYDAERDRATVVFSADRGVIERPGTSYRGSESRAIRQRRPVLEDASFPHRAIVLLGPETDEETTRSALAVPLIHDGRVLGVVSVQSYRSGAYTEADLELLTAIGDLAAVAIWNARTVKELELQRVESEKLEEVSRALTASLDLTEVLQRIARSTRDLVSADGAGVWLLGPDDRAELAITAGDQALPVGTTIVVPTSLRRRLEQTGDPLVLDRDSQGPAIPPGILDVLEAESAIAVPLVTEGELIGALSVSHMEGRGYPPRVDIFLEKEFAAAERGRSLAVVMFDLNDFKGYNDTKGHQAGDAVLRRFAQILVMETRAMNMAARYGGDEFICILSDTDEHGGASHAGRVFRAVQRDPEMSELGVCAGVAAYHSDMISAEELIREADRELYRAKASRNGEIASS